MVYIFNNRNFTRGDGNLHLRAGSEKDVQRLFDTFDELNFDVECYIDKTAKELQELWTFRGSSGSPKGVDKLR